MAEPNVIHIDLDRLHDIAQKGVRRAAAFLALGVNAARNPEVIDYQFPKDAFTHILPDGLNDESVATLKMEFEKWVILSGLRELIETFGVYCDEVHDVVLLIEMNSGKIDAVEAQRITRVFEKKGLEGKLNVLKNQFNITTQKDKYLVSINRVRNCLAHRRGIVKANDTDSSGLFRVTWWALDLIAESPAGSEIKLTAPVPPGGILLEAGGHIKVRFVDRERVFHRGQVVELTMSELSEICFLTSVAAKEIINSVASLAKVRGIFSEMAKKEDSL